MRYYVVTLTAEDREQLQALIRSGQASALRMARARVLPRADAAPSARPGRTNGSPRHLTSGWPPSPGAGSGSSDLGWPPRWSGVSKPGRLAAGRGTAGP